MEDERVSKKKDGDPDKNISPKDNIISELENYNHSSKLLKYYGIDIDDIKRFKKIMVNVDKLCNKFGYNFSMSDLDTFMEQSKDKMISSYLIKISLLEKAKLDIQGSDSKEKRKPNKVLGFSEKDRSLIEKIKKYLMMTDEDEGNATDYIKTKKVGP